MPDAYICGRMRRTKITRKASDVAEYIELFGSFTRDRRARRRIIGRRSENNIECVVHDDLGRKNRTTRYILSHRITGFTSDFLSFIDVELIRFFHGAIQL